MATNLLELPARFVRPLLAWIEATPIYILLVLFILFILLGLFSVRYPLALANRIR